MSTKKKLRAQITELEQDVRFGKARGEEFERAYKTERDERDKLQEEIAGLVNVLIEKADLQIDKKKVAVSRGSWQ